MDDNNLFNKRMEELNQQFSETYGLFEFHLTKYRKYKKRLMRIEYDIENLKKEKLTQKSSSC